MNIAGAQSGFTLIELMVGLVLGLVVTSALFWIYVGNIRATKDSIKAARLNNDLRAAMELMVSDIRRAGYWDGVVDTSATPPVVKDLFDEVGNPPDPPGMNPFADPDTGTDIAVGEKTGEATNSCITYTYDFDRNGSVDIDNDGYGFGLTDGVVRTRVRGSAFDCSTMSGWQGITDSNFVNITGLVFRVTDDPADPGAPSSSCQNLDMTCAEKSEEFRCGDPEATRCCWRSLCSDTEPVAGEYTKYTAPSPGHRLIETRVVVITLAGEVADDRMINKTLTEVVKVRNDRALRWP